MKRQRQHIKKWNEQLGQQIKTARESAGLTQDALARTAGVSRQMLNQYENARRDPPTEALAKIAVRLGQPLIVSGYTIEVHRGKASRTAPPQLRLDFDKTHSYPGAVLKIRPSTAQIVIETAVKRVAW
jgi:putative transcriptional regulator